MQMDIDTNNAIKFDSRDSDDERAHLDAYSSNKDQGTSCETSRYSYEGDAHNDSNSGGMNKGSSDEQALASKGEATNRDPSDVWRARLLLLASAALYGTNFSLVKLLGDSLPIGVSTTLRFGLASLAGLPWLLPNPKEDVSLQDTVAAAWLGFEVGLWNSIGYIAQAIGLETTDASKSAFICSLAVVTVPLIEFATGKKLKSREWAGAMLAVLGVGMLELGGGQLQSGEPLLSRGDLLSFIQPLAFGIGFWRVESAMNRFPGQASRTTAAQLLAVALASAGYAVWSTDVAMLQSYPWAEWLTSPSIILSIIWTGLITTGLTILMETQALRTLTAAETTLIFSTEPLFGTAFASVVMGEQLGAGAALGSVLILVGCLYSNLGIEGIQSVWKSAELPQKVAKTRFGAYVSKTPQRVRSEWLWLCCSIAANVLTFAWILEEELPELQAFLAFIMSTMRSALLSIRIY